MHQIQKTNIVTDELSTQVITQVERCYTTVENFFKRSFSRPHIELNLRGQSAGTANLQNNSLRFNKQLLIENKQHFLKQTVPHEVAHLIAYQLFGIVIKPHGKEWRYIMQIVFQLPAERCHHYKIDRKTKRYYLYNCQCMTLIHPLTARRHHLIAQGYQYICKYCKKRLNFTGQTDYQ